MFSAMLNALFLLLLMLATSEQKLIPYTVYNTLHVFLDTIFVVDVLAVFFLLRTFQRFVFNARQRFVRRLY